MAAERLHSPAAERNRGPILAALLQRLPAQGTALEIAAGTGQHAAYFAAALPGWTWQPTDAFAESLPSIAAWCEGLTNVLPPLVLDVLQPQWAGVPERVDLVYCANMVHISPWVTTPALLQGAARHADAAARLVLYGPYLVDGEATAPGNLAFDVDLRTRNPAWGLRRLQAVVDEARRAGWHFDERVAMPANNLLLFFSRVGSAGA